MCSQASFFIYEKMKVEGFAGYDDVRLKTAIRVPRRAVGQLIGKGGRTVREIQRNTGSIIKLSNDKDSNCDDDETMVFVYGSFISTQVSSIFSCSN
jgi:insulin-like growth factor 2 mRNA-binding protein 1